MTAFWLGVLLGSAGLAALRWLVQGASDLTAPAEDDESLVAAFFADLAVTEQELDEERQRADRMAEALRDLLFGSDDDEEPTWLGVDRAVAALGFHNAARAAEVAR